LEEEGYGDGWEGFHFFVVFITESQSFKGDIQLLDAESRWHDRREGKDTEVFERFF